MTYRFPELIEREKGSPGLIQRALAAGKLGHGNMTIELPDDFDFNGPAPASVPPPIVIRHLQPVEPTILELLTNFAGAMERWSAAGFPIITQAQYDQRGKICSLCEFWDGDALLGLGKCNAQGCGCTKFKRWLATETCRHPDGSKWPPLNPP
jgi:hypothetical protein